MNNMNDNNGNQELADAEAFFQEKTTDKQETESQATSQARSGPNSVSKMIRQLLARNITPQQIAVAIGATDQAIQDWMSGSELPAAGDLRLECLEVLHMKSRIKSIYRQNEYVGPEKAAAKLGVDLDSYKDLYDALLESGELTYTLESPDWYSPDGSKQLRKHRVVR